MITALSGCGEEEPEELVYDLPIEGWNITLPENSEFVRNLFSGPVENHEYNPNMSEGEFFIFLEKAMEMEGWLIDSSFQDGRDFKSVGDDFVQITYNPASGYVFIIIEPQGTYGDDEEVTKETE